jgi:hypothetical protein
MGCATSAGHGDRRMNGSSSNQSPVPSPPTPLFSPAAFGRESFEARLVPDIMRPEQFLCSLQNVHHAPWLTTLRRAVLEDAVLCFQRQSVAKKPEAQRLAREAKAWLFADDHDWPLSFANVYNVLRLEPAYIRRGLSQWSERQRPGPLWTKRRRMVRSFPPKIVSLSTHRRMARKS